MLLGDLNSPSTKLYQPLPSSPSYRTYSIADIKFHFASNAEKAFVGFGAIFFPVAVG